MSGSFGQNFPAIDCYSNTLQYHIGIRIDGANRRGIRIVVLSELQCVLRSKLGPGMNYETICFAGFSRDVCLRSKAV